MSGSEDPDPTPPPLAERILASVPGLARYVRRRMGPELAQRESASDIVQSTCRELLRCAAGYEERGEASFQRWVRATAEHKLQNRARHWRALRRQEPSPREEPTVREEPPPPAEPADAASYRPSQEAMLREEVERLTRAFDALDPEQRAWLVRSQIEGQSYGEMAHGTGRSPEAVRKLVARAMARLASALAPE